MIRSNRNWVAFLKKVLYPITGCCLILFCGCNDSKPDEEVFLRINEDLLGESYSDSLLAIEMRIPAAMTDITHDIEDLVTEIFAGSETEYEQELIFRKGYGDIDKLAFLLLFDFDYSQIAADREEAIEVYIADFSETAKVLQQWTFIHNGIRFHQLTSHDDFLINIKLLAAGQENSLFALDYYMPPDLYLDYIETIESSIGSLTKH